jgi:hypothetical protein
MSGLIKVGAPYGINFSQATRVPDRIKGERDEELIEKHALMDSMLEKRAWGKGYVVNPFCYLTEDIAEFSDRDLSALKECFLFHYNKYEKFKEMNKHLEIPKYENRMIDLMKHQHGFKDQKLMLEIEDERIASELRNEVIDLHQLKLDYWKMTTSQNQRNQGSPPKLPNK